MQNEQDHGTQKAAQEIMNAMVDYRKRPAGSSMSSSEPSEPEY